jgi:hypothetical protein
VVFSNQAKNVCLAIQYANFATMIQPNVSLALWDISKIVMELARNHVALDNLHMLFREYAKNVLHLACSAFLTVFVIVVIFPRYIPICLEKVVWLFVPMDISQIATISAKNVRATVYIVVGAQITALNAMDITIFSVI